MIAQGYEVIRLKPEKCGFAETVREARQICDDLLGEGLYSEQRISEVCQKKNHYFFVISKQSQIEGIFYCYADRAGNVPFAENIEDLSADTRIGVAQSIALKREARQKGVAAAVLNYATELLFHKEKIKLILALAWMQEKEIPAKKHLEKCGFRLLKIQKRPWSSCEKLSCPACGQQPCVCDGAVYVKEGNDDE